MTAKVVAPPVADGILNHQSGAIAIAARLNEPYGARVAAGLVVPLLANMSCCFSCSTISGFDR